MKNEVEITTDFEVNVSGIPFNNGESYIVGFDTIGDGVRFGLHPYVCLSQEDIEDEVYRVISENDLNPCGGITLEEYIVIAKFVESYKIGYQEYEFTTTKRSV
jgi:hypothetical protein